MGPVLNRAPISQCPMRAIVVVPLHPVPDDSPRFLKRLERVLPDALFFETAKEPFDDPVLLRRVRGHECVVQPIVPTRLPKLTALEDQAVVTAENRRSRRPQRSEPGETGGFHGALRRLRPTPQGELVAPHFAVVTVDHRRQMRVTRNSR